MGLDARMACWALNELRGVASVSEGCSASISEHDGGGEQSEGCAEDPGGDDRAGNPETTKHGTVPFYEGRPGSRRGRMCDATADMLRFADGKVKYC